MQWVVNGVHYMGTHGPRLLLPVLHFSSYDENHCQLQSVGARLTAISLYTMHCYWLRVWDISHSNKILWECLLTSLWGVTYCQVLRMEGECLVHFVTCISTSYHVMATFSFHEQCVSGYKSSLIAKINKMQSYMFCGECIQNPQS